MSLPRNIIKKRGIPLNIVNLSTSKKLKIQHISVNKRAGNSTNQIEETLPDYTHQENCFSDDVWEEEADSNEMTSGIHTRRKLKAAERWESVQTVAMNTVIYSYSQPCHAVCSICQLESGIVKCYNCTPMYFYCEACAVQSHKHKLFHHFMEIWQVYTGIML